MKKIEQGNIDDKIRTYGTKYRGTSYRAIAVVDEKGYVDKIFQAKNGEIHAIYDIITPLKAGKTRIYAGEPNKKITADCYFYDKENEKIEYMKNITNNISEFNACCDFEYGGAKKVDKNIDKSPIEVYAQGSSPKTYTYWFNYGKKDEERVSACDFGNEKSRKKYTKIEPSILMQKLNAVKSYFTYENIENRPEHRLVIIRPKIGIEDYNLGA